MLVSAVQRNDSVICINISHPSRTSLTPLFHPTPPPSHLSRSSQNTNLGSLCYTAGSCSLFSLHIVVYKSELYWIECICVDPNLLSHPTFPLLPRVHISILYIYISIPPLQIGSLVPFSHIFHMHALIYSICFSLSDLLHSVWQTVGYSTSLQMIQFYFSFWLINMPLYIFITFSLSLHLSMDI